MRLSFSVISARFLQKHPPHNMKYSSQRKHTAHYQNHAFKRQPIFKIHLAAAAYLRTWYTGQRFSACHFQTDSPSSPRRRTYTVVQFRVRVAPSSPFSYKPLHDHFEKRNLADHTISTHTTQSVPKPLILPSPSMQFFLPR